MASVIEGVGDEVVCFLVALFVIALISLAWISTGLPPVDQYVWLVQLQINPNRRIVQILQFDNREANSTVDRRERRRSSAVTDQTLESLMESSAVEQNNMTTEESMLSRTAEVSQNQRSDNRNSINAQETLLQPQQDMNQTEFSHSVLSPNLGAVGSQVGQHDDRSASFISVEDEKESGTVETFSDTNRELAATLTDSARRLPTTEKHETTGHQLSCVRLKFLDDSQILACTALESTVGQFKRRYFCESLLAGKVVRLIYRGQLLRDDTRSLLSYGLHDQCVVHCHVSSSPYANHPSSAALTPTNNSMLVRENEDINTETAATAVTALADPQLVSINTTQQLTRRIIQTFRGQSIEDDRNESMLLRVCNAFLRFFRRLYNTVMGPNLSLVTANASLDEAADAASRGVWNQNQNPVGSRIAQYIHIIFIVKFVTLWTFVFWYPQYTDRFSVLLLSFLSIFFATVLFSNRMENNRNNIESNSGVRTQS